MVPAEEDAPPAMFQNEPLTFEEVMNMYHIENMMAARQPGAALWLTHAGRRDGTIMEVTENQQFKLWLATRTWPSVFS